MQTPRARKKDELALVRDAARFGRDAAWELSNSLGEEALALASAGRPEDACARMEAGYDACARLGLGRAAQRGPEAVFLEACRHPTAELVASFAQEDGPGRAGGLAVAAWSVHAAFERQRAAEAGAAWERRVPGRGCCGGCLGLAAFGWRPAGELPGPGSGPCDCRCSCRFAYAAGRRPERPGVAEAVLLPAEMGLEAAHEWCEAHGFAHGRALRQDGRLVFSQHDSPPGHHPGGPASFAGEGVVTVDIDRERGVQAVVRLSEGTSRHRFWRGEELADWSAGELASLEPHEAAWALDNCELDEAVEAVLRAVAAGEGTAWDAVRGESHVRDADGQGVASRWPQNGQPGRAPTVWADPGTAGPEAWGSTAAPGAEAAGAGMPHAAPSLPSRASRLWASPGNSGYTGRSPGSPEPWAGFSGPPSAWDLLAAGAPESLAWVLAGHAHGLSPSQDILPFPQGGDPDANPHLAAAARLLRAARMNEADTRRAWAGPGGYHPLRAELHRRLAAAALDPAAAAPAGVKPLAVLAIGSHCAGKSAFGMAAALEMAGGWTVASSNGLMEGLPEYQGWNAPLLHSEAEDVAALARHLAAARRHNVFVEHVGHDLEEAWALAGRLALDGYDIHLVLADVPPEVAAARAAARFLDNPFGLAGRSTPPGRYVPPEYVAADVGRLPARTYLELRDHPAVASWRSYDASGGPGSVPRLLDAGTR